MSRVRGSQDGPSGILVDAFQLPITASLCLLAIGLTLISWTTSGHDPFVMDERAFGAESWRLFSANLVHGDVLHLAFNLYWTWQFGRMLEPLLGAIGFLVVVLFLGVGVNLTSHALDVGGIGLSGIAYGLWGLLALGGRWIEPLRGRVDRRVNGLFLGWFVLCVALTRAGVWNVSNVGHAAGAALGGVLALGLRPDLRLTALRGALLGLVPVLLLVAATVGRPYVNLGDGAAQEKAAGDRAMERGDHASAVERYEAALRMNRDDGDAWYRYGWALARQGRTAKGLEAVGTAYELGFRDEDMTRWLTVDVPLLCDVARREGRTEDALAYALASARVQPDASSAWMKVLEVAREAHDAAAEERARAELKRLGVDPN